MTVEQYRLSKPLLLAVKKTTQREVPRNIATDVLKMFYENIQL